MARDAQSFYCEGKHSSVLETAVLFHFCCASLCHSIKYDYYYFSYSTACSMDWILALNSRGKMCLFLLK